MAKPVSGTMHTFLDILGRTFHGSTFYCQLAMSMLVQIKRYLFFELNNHRRVLGSFEELDAFAVAVHLSVIICPRCGMRIR